MMMIEKRCYRCGEFWPADEEFFNRLSDGRLHSYCRACCTERKRELRLTMTHWVVIEDESRDIRGAVWGLGDDMSEAVVDAVKYMLEYQDNSNKLTAGHRIDTVTITKNDRGCFGGVSRAMKPETWKTYQTRVCTFAGSNPASHDDNEL